MIRTEIGPWSSGHTPKMSYKVFQIAAGLPSMNQRSRAPRALRMPVPTSSSYRPPLCPFHRRLPVPPQVEALVPAHDHQYFCVYCVLSSEPQAQAPNDSFTTSHSDVFASGIEPPYEYVLPSPRCASISLTAAVSMILCIIPVNMNHHRRHHRRHRRRRRRRRSIR